MAELGKIIGKPKEIKRFTADDRFVLPKSLVGVEYEFEGVLSDKTDQNFHVYWGTHRDESLKENGMEFSFKTPLFGEDLYNAIVSMHEAAKLNNYKCSVRCGIHIHSDARDMEGAQLIGQTILYAIFEPLIFRWIGDNRENSIFCIPFYKADDSLLESGGVIKAITLDEGGAAGATLSSAGKVSRYAAYNLNALYKFGSVEFRHMRTTMDMQRVIDWINIIQSLKAATFQLPTSDGAIIEMAKKLSPNVFLTTVFGPELARKLWCADAVDLIRKVGIPTAKDLVLYGLTLNDFDDVPDGPQGTHDGFTKYMARPNPRSPADPYQGVKAQAPRLRRNREYLDLGDDRVRQEAIDRLQRANREMAAARPQQRAAGNFIYQANEVLGEQERPQEAAPAEPYRFPNAPDNWGWVRPQQPAPEDNLFNEEEPNQ